MNDDYIKICKINDLEENQGKRFLINNVEIALFKVNGDVYAISNICPHQHTALIYDGFIENEFVACPAHGWMFSLITGKKPDGSRGIQTYPVKVINNEVFARVKSKELKW